MSRISNTGWNPCYFCDEEISSWDGGILKQQLYCSPRQLWTRAGGRDEFKSFSSSVYQIPSPIVFSSNRADLIWRPTHPPLCSRLVVPCLRNADLYTEFVDRSGIFEPVPSLSMTVLTILLTVDVRSWAQRNYFGNTSSVLLTLYKNESTVSGTDRCMRASFPDPWRFDTDSDPVLFFSGFQDAYCLLITVGICTICTSIVPFENVTDPEHRFTRFLKIKSHKEVTKM